MVCGSEKHEDGWCRKIRSVQVASAGLRDKETDRQLRQYKRARDEGILPWGTGVDKKTGKLHSEVAMEMSDQKGRAFRADDVAGSMYPDEAKLLREWTDPEKKAIRAG